MWCWCLDKWFMKKQRRQWPKSNGTPATEIIRLAYVHRQNHIFRKLRRRTNKQSVLEMSLLHKLVKISMLVFIKCVSGGSTISYIEGTGCVEYCIEIYNRSCQCSMALNVLFKSEWRKVQQTDGHWTKVKVSTQWKSMVSLIFSIVFEYSSGHCFK